MTRTSPQIDFGRRPGGTGLSRRALLRAAAVAGSFAALALPGMTAGHAGEPVVDRDLHALFDRILAARAQPDVASAAQAGLLRSFDPTGLSARGRLDRAAVLDVLEAEAGLQRAWPFGTVGSRPSPFTVSPQAGAYRSAAAGLAKVAAGDLPKATAELAERLDRETERLREEAAAGIVLPRPVLEETLARLRALALPGAAGAALARQAAVLEDRRGQAPDGPGLGRLPGGDAGYAAMLSLASTAPIAPEEAHRLGLDLAEALTTEAEPLLRSLGLAEGTLGDRFRALAAQPEYAYPDSEAGRDQAVADMNAHLARVRSLLPASFGELPNAEITVHRLTADEIAAGRQGWRDNPSFDGRKSGGYHVDLSRIDERPRWALPTMTDHETLPGHLLQAAWQERAGLHPLRARLVSGAILEGWSAYAQRLVLEWGTYDDDPAARAGVIQSLLFRVGRMLADTGLHSRGWTREQAIRTIIELGGEPDSTAAAEVDRMSVLPGFLTGHMVGYARTLQMRDRVKAAEGARFDLRRFHDPYLSPGPLPLTVLAQHLTGEVI